MAHDMLIHEPTREPVPKPPKRFYSAEGVFEASLDNDVGRKLHVRSTKFGAHRNLGPLRSYVPLVEYFEMLVYKALEHRESDPRECIKQALKETEKYADHWNSSPPRQRNQVAADRLALQHKVNTMMKDFSVPVGGSHQGHFAARGPRGTQLGSTGSPTNIGRPLPSTSVSREAGAVEMAQFQSCDGNVYTFPKKVKSGTDWRPAPNFFMDLLLLAVSEAAKGGDPLDIFRQANFTLRDAEGNEVFNFTGGPPVGEEEEDHTAPSNATFNDE